LLTVEEIQQCFLNVTDIWQMSVSMYRNLDSVWKKGRATSSDLPNVFKQYAPYFKIYRDFVANYKDAEKLMKELRQTRPALDFFFDFE